MFYPAQTDSRQVATLVKEREQVWWRNDILSAYSLVRKLATSVVPRPNRVRKQEKSFFAAAKNINFNANSRIHQQAYNYHLNINLSDH